MSERKDFEATVQALDERSQANEARQDSLTCLLSAVAQPLPTILKVSYSSSDSGLLLKRWSSRQGVGHSNHSMTSELEPGSDVPRRSSSLMAFFIAAPSFGVSQGLPFGCSSKELSERKSSICVVPSLCREKKT